MPAAGIALPASPLTPNMLAPPWIGQVSVGAEPIEK